MKNYMLVLCLLFAFLLFPAFAFIDASKVEAQKTKTASPPAPEPPARYDTTEVFTVPDLKSSLNGRDGDCVGFVVPNGSGGYVIVWRVDIVCTSH